MIPYELLDRAGSALLTDWELEKQQRRQLTILLMNLEQVDYEVAVGSLIFKKSGASGIYYSKINGQVALRPRCCVGPPLSMEEFRELRSYQAGRGEPRPAESVMFPAGKAEILTYLERVTKKGGKEHPPHKDSRASERMQSLETKSGRRQQVRMHHKKGNQG